MVAFNRRHFWRTDCSASTANVDHATVIVSIPNRPVFKQSRSTRAFARPKAAAGAYAAAKAAFAEAFAAGAGAFRSSGAKIAYGVGRLLGNIGKAGPVPKIDPPKTIPQGFSEAEFASASEVIRSQTAHLGDDIFVHGSRASGTAKATSDIDFGIRVTSERFEELIQLRFGTPTPGSAKFRTMEHALKTGKIQAGEAGLRGLRSQLERALGREVDISVIRAGGAFDKGPYIPIR